MSEKLTVGKQEYRWSQLCSICVYVLQCQFWFLLTIHQRGHEENAFPHTSGVLDSLTPRMDIS